MRRGSRRGCSRGSPPSILEVGDSVARNDGPARQFRVIHVEEARAARHCDGKIDIESPLVGGYAVLLLALGDDPERVPRAARATPRSTSCRSPKIPRGRRPA